jgi:hypothetical protein
MDWVPGRTWGWLGPSGSLCNELFIHSFIEPPRGLLLCNCFFLSFLLLWGTSL